MIKHALYLTLLLHLCGYGQEVSSIRFEGLRKTKEQYVRQFLTVGIGDVLDSATLEEDKVTLTNLEVFGRADFEVRMLSDRSVEVVFLCEELYTLLPIFSFGGIEENFWVQAGVSESNLGGYGHKLKGYYQYYDRSSIAAHLTFDRIKQSKWGAHLNVIKWSTLEPLFFSEQTLEYEYDNWTFGATAIRFFNFRDKLEFGGAYFTEDYTRSTSGTFEGIPDQVRTRKILGKVLYTVDRVNYYYFYQDGIRNQLNVQTVHSLDGDDPFHIVFNDYHLYQRVGTQGNFASRLRLGLSTNEESPFAPFVLDSYLNIRGVGDRVDRGTGAIILNMEYRYVFLEKKKVAIQAVAFSDSGSWRNPGGNFDDFSDANNFVLFAGGGLRFIHKQIFNAILRVDYGFNLQQREVNGFVLGVGQYF